MNTIPQNTSITELLDPDFLLRMDKAVEDYADAQRKASEQRATDLDHRIMVMNEIAAVFCQSGLNARDAAHLAFVITHGGFPRLKVVY